MAEHNLPIGAETLRRMAQVDRYHQWLVERMSAHLGSKVLEVGCGTGNVTRELLARVPAVVATDLSPDYIAQVKAEFADREGFEAIACDICEPAAESLSKYSVDTVVCLNVLEHIADDRRALSVMRGTLSPGGKLILFVPALAALYGTLDRALDHHRRYQRRALRALLQETGFEILEESYMNMAGIFGWFLNSRILKRELLPEGQLRLYNRLVPIIRWVDRISGPPIGQSLFYVCRRRG